MKHVTLYPFQRSGVKQIQDFDGRALIADAVGLGKTIQSLYWCWKFLPDDPPGPVVVVVPAHLRLNWQREALKHLGMRVEILYGLKVPPDMQKPINPNQVYVLSYNSLVPPHWKSRMPPPADSWMSWLLNLKPRLLVADEAHYLKENSSGRTRAVRRLAREIPHVLLLTATPLANKPQDLWSLLNILKPKLFPSLHDFCMEFTHARLQWWGWEYKGARNLDKLNEILLREVMIRRRKEDVLSELPTMRHSVIPIEVNLREYRNAENDFLGWLEQQSPRLAKNAAKAQQLAKMNTLRMLAAKAKIQSVIDWVGDFLEESEGKLLLGAIHYDVTEPILDEFKSQYGAVLVDGRISAREKDTLCERFNADPKCRLLIGNIDAAGTGWSCRSTSDVVMVEEPFRPCDLVQFAGRVDGIARGLPGTAAHIQHLVAVGTIDEDLCEIIQRKAEWSDVAIDGGTGTDSLDVHDQVLRAIKRRSGK